ncbi:hypothetical protein KI387_025911, partial [Taxus chinensis]
ILQDSGLQRRQYLVETLPEEKARKILLKESVYVDLQSLDLDLERILMLEEPTQEAFLDICCYFNNWNWQYVDYIMGKKHVQSLEEATLVSSTIKMDRDDRDPEREFDNHKMASLKKIKGLWLMKRSDVIVDLQRAQKDEHQGGIYEKHQGGFGRIHVSLQLKIEGFKEDNFSRADFPQVFIFGAGTSAYQVEGAVADNGRKPSIWDTYTHSDGKGAINPKGSEYYSNLINEFILHETVKLYREKFQLAPSGLAVAPWGLQALLEYLKQHYGNPPIIIYEN